MLSFSGPALAPTTRAAARPRKVHSKVLTSGQRRSPRRRSHHLAAVSRGLACLGATSCALVRPSDEKSESATGASHVLSGRTAALARRGIAIWDRVPRAGVVRHDVASLPAPSRAVRCSEMPKSSTFRTSRVASRRVGDLSGSWLSVRACIPRSQCLRTAAASGVSWAVPPQCLARRRHSVHRTRATCPPAGAPPEANLNFN